MTIWVWGNGNPCSWDSQVFASWPVELWGDGEDLYVSYMNSTGKLNELNAGILADWCEENLPPSPTVDRLLIFLRTLFNGIYITVSEQNCPRKAHYDHWRNATG